MTGRVKWFNDSKGYGYIAVDGSADVFVHFTSILGEGFKTLQEGWIVQFDLYDGSKGPQAKNVQKVTI